MLPRSLETSFAKRPSKRSVVLEDDPRFPLLCLADLFNVCMAMSSSTTFGPQHSGNFHEFLAQNLRAGINLRVYHVSTPPTSVSPIFTPPPGQDDEHTTCESHFLGVSQKHVTGSGNVQHSCADSSEGSTLSKEENVLVLGIEVLVFSTSSVTTIFVSKADSTGFLPRSPGSFSGSFSLIRGVISIFLEWLVSRKLSSATPEASGGTKPSQAPLQSELVETREAPSNTTVAKTPVSQLTGRRLVLSLFARSQNQYLFPGSIENETKHVLDDRQLIKWWCQVLNSLVQKKRTVKIRTGDARHESNLSLPLDKSKTSSAESPQLTREVAVTSDAFIIVPGCDRLETRRSFFPPSANHGPGDVITKWHNSFPAEFLVGHDISKSKTALPIRCMIPRLPDDPKARYCDDLDGAGTDDKGQWKVIRSLQQFWETMEFRQECSAGRLVGFIWVTFRPGLSHDPSDEGKEKLAVSPKVSNGYIELTDVHLPPHPQTQDSQKDSPPGSLMLTSEQYIELSDFLINKTDFAGPSLAIKSTSEWIAKAKELSGAIDFGVEINGKSFDAPSSETPQEAAKVDESSLERQKSDVENKQSSQIHVITTVRRKAKRKAEALEAEDNTTEGRSQAIPNPSGQDASQSSVEVLTKVEPVQMLSGGLVRKKPKP